MNHTDIEEREQEALNDLDDAKERIGQLEEDLRSRDAEISKLRAALGQWCDSDSEIEKQCAEILGHDYVKGDSYSVPGTLACVEEVVKRFKQSKTDLAEITQLAVDYKEANMRLEEELREFHAKDGGRTREHNLLVQENRRLREALNAIAHHPGADSDRNELDSGEWRDALVQIAREALKPTK